MPIVCAPTDLPVQALPLETIHAALASSYWAQGLPRSTFERALAHSLNFVALEGGRFVGFARVISDHATFAYLCDVWVEPDARGQGISKQLMRAIEAHPDLQGLRRQMLMTRDAHGLYAQSGFTPLAHPEYAMEKHDAQVYAR